MSQTSRSAATGPSDTVALRNLEIRTLPGPERACQIWMHVHQDLAAAPF